LVQRPGMIVVSVGTRLTSPLHSGGRIAVSGTARSNGRDIDIETCKESCRRVGRATRRTEHTSGGIRFNFLSTRFPLIDSDGRPPCKSNQTDTGHPSVAAMPRAALFNGRQTARQMKSDKRSALQADWPHQNGHNQRKIKKNVATFGLKRCRQHRRP